MAIIQVNSPDGTYPIHIERGLLSQLEELIGNRRKIIITNTQLEVLYDLPAPVLTMLPGERHKNLVTVSDLYSQMIRAGADRKSVIVAFGGGVVGDTAGFVAATYMRGVPFIQMPTSLLAMVDSSVGGKVGVDLPEGKNLVGAFKQPEMVIIDPDVLNTLPDVEWRNGMAEVIKHGLIADEALLDPALHTVQNATELVKRAVQVKVDVVQRDPYEHGERAHLNLGHTFAHAIEQVSGYSWTHGEAVGYGLLAAARLSYALGLCQATLVDHIDTLLAHIGLPRKLGNLDPSAIFDAMRTDKKWQNGRSRFVLLRGIGQPLIMEDIARDVVIEVLQT
ncbi:MAG: 3-dehydroquinate synthase [Phototrophicales bacterium]|nr:MAG: 3-dehydroquinate synthase [Phototrophicales bacterium]RMG73297.1 MAG: 3-dehydroquinate synthase [Chloroflexota bacterium]